MRGRRSRWRATGSRDEGASLVEFAFVVPLLLLFTFAIVDFGVTYNNQQALRTAVREGARRLIVGPSKVTESGCTGATDGRCLVKARGALGGLHRNDISVKICFPSAPAGASCPGSDPGGKNAGDTIRICAIYPVESASGLLSPFLGGRRLTSRVDLRLEQPWPNGTTNPPPDPPSRGDWSFCDA